MGALQFVYELIRFNQRYPIKGYPACMGGEGGN